MGDFLLYNNHNHYEENFVIITMRTFIFIIIKTFIIIIIMRSIIIIIISIVIQDLRRPGNARSQMTLDT